MTRPSEILGSVVAASEREQLDTFLDCLRDAVVRRARGVSEEDARRSPEANLRLEPNEKLDDVIGTYQTECDRSREIAAQHRLEYAPQGSELKVRRVYLHAILETGRRAGHADILREMIDGSVGD